MSTSAAGRVGVVALLTALLAVVASGVGGGTGHGGTGHATSGLAARALLDVGSGVAAAAVLLIAGVLIGALWNQRGRKRNPDQHVSQAPRVPWGLRVGLVGALMALVLAGFAVLREPGSSRPPVPPERPPPELPDDRPASTPPDSGWADGPIIAGVALLGVGAVTLGLARRRHRPAGTEVASTAVATPAVAEPQLTVDDLAVVSDPRQAVIAAYAWMERVLGTAGLARRPSEAPFEYLGRIRDAPQVATAPATRLTELFERAKFSRRGADPAMQAEAVDALRILLDRATVTD